MTNVQLPGAAAYDSQMEIHTSNVNTDTSLSREFQKHLSDPTRAHGLLYHGKDIKHASKRKWNDCDYHVQERNDVSHTSVKMSCATTKLPELSFCGPHAKHHGVRRLIKNYHLLIDPKVVNGKYATQRVTCDCI